MQKSDMIQLKFENNYSGPWVEIGVGSKSRSKESSQETIIIAQARDDHSLEAVKN